MYSALFLTYPAILQLFTISDTAIICHIGLGGVESAELGYNVYI
jgi:hypothetical protein